MADVQRFLINLDEYHERLLVELRNHIGVVAEVANLQPILNDMITCYFHGPMFGGDYVDKVMGYGIPMELATSITSEIFSSMCDYITECMGTPRNDGFIDFELDPNGDLFIQREGDEPDAMERLKDEIRAGLERGDFYSERELRMVGL